jgi:hypothetical protein
MLSDYIFVNRRSKPHIRKRARDTTGELEPHPNKVQSHINFARAAHANYGRAYPDFITGIQDTLVGIPIKPPPPVPALSKAERAALKLQAVNRGTDPRIINELTAEVPVSPIDILCPNGEIDRERYLDIILPRRLSQRTAGTISATRRNP